MTHDEIVVVDAYSTVGAIFVNVGFYLGIELTAPPDSVMTIGSCCTLYFLEVRNYFECELILCFPLCTIHHAM